ncbi:hypothetical protein T459_07832 [Capsicum annuum]|uniref:Non-haem dioxygenase N-terminal domain-containing protein n=1 Tax=Capsicum annuum TaxID=4072 RepID=A0A2G2ZUT3_CAPAN|nr:hypothetical protein T459_07832 [Capsicum annuum]
MESEFIALDKAGEEAEWLRNFLKDIPYWPKPVAPIPVVDLSGIEAEDRYKKVVDEIRETSEKYWGFFQLINHEVRPSVLEGMIGGTHKFH